MKRILISLSALALVAMTSGLASAHPWAPRADRREDFQRVRIERGIRTGQLTRREAKRLHRREMRTERMENRLGRDGRFTPRERMRMNRALDRNSRMIFRFKHNLRHRSI